MRSKIAECVVFGSIVGLFLLALYAAFVTKSPCPCPVRPACCAAKGGGEACK